MRTSVRVITSASSGFGVDVCSPGAGCRELSAKQVNGGPQAVVAGPAEGHGLGLAGLVGEWSNAGFGGQAFVAGEAFADSAEFGEDLGGANTAGAGEAHQDPSIVERYAM